MSTLPILLTNDLFVCLLVTWDYVHGLHFPSNVHAHFAQQAATITMQWEPETLHRLSSLTKLIYPIDQGNCHDGKTKNQTSMGFQATQLGHWPLWGSALPRDGSYPNNERNPQPLFQLLECSYAHFAGIGTHIRVSNKKWVINCQI